MYKECFFWSGERSSCTGGAVSQLSALDFVDYVLLCDSPLEAGKVDELSSQFIGMKGFFSFC